MGTPDERHTLDPHLVGRWVVVPSLLPDELLSSWLLRAAAAQGSDPLDFTGAIWPGWRIWTVDPDRCLDAARLKPLLDGTGISAQAFEAASLSSVVRSITGQAVSIRTSMPWILTLGHRNRRRNGGLQYCPRCLAEDGTPYFRRAWRFASHVGCSRHSEALHDHCWRCGSPVEPQRLQATAPHLATCASCGSDLRNAPARPVERRAATFQAAADHVLESGYGIALGERLDRVTWFALASYFISLVRRVNRDVGQRGALTRLVGDVCGELPAFPVGFGASLEKSSNRTRQVLLSAAGDFMLMDRRELRRKLLGHGVTRGAFSPSGGVVRHIVDDLCDGLIDRRRSIAITGRPASPREPDAVRRMYVRLLRRWGEDDAHMR